MKKIVFAFMVFIFIFSSAVAADFLTKRWHEDIDGDGVKEIFSLYQEQWSGGNSAYVRLSVLKDGQEIFPQGSEMWVGSKEGTHHFVDIDPRLPGKEVLILRNDDNHCSIYFYGLINGKYQLYNSDITDKAYDRWKPLDTKAIIREIERGTKFQRAIRVTEKFLGLLARKDEPGIKKMLIRAEVVYWIGNHESFDYSSLKINLLRSEANNIKGRLRFAFFAEQKEPEITFIIIIENNDVKVFQGYRKGDHDIR